MAPSLLRILLLVECCVLSGCAVGPDYRRPAAPVPQTFKEAGEWKVAEPQDERSRGAWWKIFGDRQLDELESQVNISNQNVLAAEAQFREARALVREARAAYFPTLSAQASATRSDAGSGVQRVSTVNNNIATSGIGDSYIAQLNGSWEADVWGRLRRSTEASVATAQASAADLSAARLSAQAELATDYFSLLVTDAQQRLLERTVDAYQETVRLTDNRYKAGVAMRSDVVQAQAQLKSAQAQLIDVQAQRAQYEHAIAVLIGKSPAEFTLAAADSVAPPPDIPLTLPSAVLEQRPDIAAAERRVAAANAQIGVARSAFFPQLTLSAAGGYRSSTTVDLFTLPNRFWSLGPALAATLFDGGARRAESARVRAAYDASVAQYRQAVLAGFQAVEDNLANLRVLANEAQVQEEAVQLARESVRLTTNQYKAGTITYLEVVTVQATLYSNERTALGLLGRRLDAAVGLVTALGGGWDAANLQNLQGYSRD